jgi:GntR family transcriptional regulator
MVQLDHLLAFLILGWWIDTTFEDASFIGKYSSKQYQGTRVMHTPLNRGLPIPLYFQLQEILRDKLEEGFWQPGDKLPTEEELCEEFHVSRTTVRRALQGLEIEGVIERSPKRGTTIAPPRTPEHILQSIVGSYALVYPQKGRLATKVLEAAVIKPPKQVLTALQLHEDDRVIKIARIRYVDSEPLFWTTAYVPYDICPDFITEDFENHSFFELLEKKHGIFILRASRSVTATIASSRAVRHLGVKPGAPLIRVIVHSYMRDDIAVEYSDTYFRGDRVRLEVEITRDEEE